MSETPVLPRRGFRPTEVAVIVGVSAKKIRELLKSGKLGSVRVGTRWVIPMTEIDRYLAENTNGPAGKS